MAASFPIVLDRNETKGSLFLRSNQNGYYSRPTLVSHWDQAREAEPKDYDVTAADKQNMHYSTYKRLANLTDGSLPITTAKEAMAEINLKSNYEEREVRKPMVTLQTFQEANFDRDTGPPATGTHDAVLPRHHPEHDKRHLETTNRADFKPPYPYTPAPERPPDFADNSAGFRKCQSQFTDTADYRRFGRNTWQEESGIYFNEHIKHALFPSTNPIPVQLE